MSSTIINVDAVMFARLLELFNHRNVSIERDSYPKQDFNIHFSINRDKIDDRFVIVSAFNNDMTIDIDLANMIVETAVKKLIHNNLRAKFNNHLDMYLYVLHILFMSSNPDTSNPMLVLTSLPSIFIMLMKIYDEINSEDEGEVATMVRGILTHTRDICFDNNTVLAMRKAQI